jgi:two-component system phosphate regulon response regulator PhoB
VNPAQLDILVVDDESAIRDMISFSLQRSGTKVRTAADAKAALISIAESRPDLILIDWMMPGVSGIELTRRLRKDSFTADIPIIMLTAKITEDDKVAGLEAGADDYVIKPFSPRELLARIRALVRRTSPSDSEGRLLAGELSIDTVARRVSHGDSDIHVGPTEYRLLAFFMSHPGRSYSRAQLLDHVWGANSYLEERTVDVHIRRLRQALEEHSCDGFLQTVRGHGYRFVVD